MIFIGVDPGRSGAIVALDENGKMVRVQRNDGTERDIFNSLCGFESADLFAIIERVHSMPRQGVSSSFKFGVSYGFLRGCLVGARIPFEERTPQQWQKVMGCMSHGDKNVTKQRAQQIFPSEKIIHQTADAFLIAEYCRRVHTSSRSES
jgi:crossover junction endodeoxyribonuclease RuvC